MAAAELPPRCARTGCDYGPFLQCALAASFDPYPYQVRLATDPWPEVVHIPTGTPSLRVYDLSCLFHWQIDISMGVQTKNGSRRMKE